MRAENHKDLDINYSVVGNVFEEKNGTLRKFWVNFHDNKTIKLWSVALGEKMWAENKENLWKS
jgi:hypothetical protein